MVVQTLHDLLVLDLSVSELVLAGPVEAFVLDLYEFIRFCTAYGTLLRRGIALVDVSAYKTSEFLFHDKVVLAFNFDKFQFR